jgi:hypothetical protein
VEAQGLPARQVLAAYMAEQQAIGHKWPRDYASELK